MDRAYPLLLGLIAVPAFGLAQDDGPRTPADIILLLEHTPGMERIVSEIPVPKASGSDRTAVMTFSKRARLRQKFTSDPAKIESAMRMMMRSGFRFLTFPRSKPPDVRLLDAIREAAETFRSLGPPVDRKRAVVVVYGSDDRGSQSSFDNVKSSLLRNHAALYGFAVRKYKVRQQPPPMRTPPPPIPERIPEIRADLPETALRAIAALARATGGRSLSGDRDLIEWAATARGSGPEQPLFPASQITKRR